MTSWFKCWPWVLGWVNVFLSQQCLLAVWVVTPSTWWLAGQRRGALPSLMSPGLPGTVKQALAGCSQCAGHWASCVPALFSFLLIARVCEAGASTSPKHTQYALRCPGSPSIRRWTQAWLSPKSMLITASQKFLWKVLMQLAPVTWQRFCSHSQCANVGWMSPWTVSFFTCELGVTLGWNRRWWGTIPILNVRGVLAIEMVGFIFMTQPARGRKPSPKIWFF